MVKYKRKVYGYSIVPKKIYISSNDIKDLIRSEFWGLGRDSFNYSSTYYCSLLEPIEFPTPAYKIIQDANYKLNPSSKHAFIREILNKDSDKMTEEEKRVITFKRAELLRKCTKIRNDVTHTLYNYEESIKLKKEIEDTFNIKTSLLCSIICLSEEEEKIYSKIYNRECEEVDECLKEEMKEGGIDDSESVPISIIEDDKAIEARYDNVRGKIIHYEDLEESNDEIMSRFEFLGYDIIYGLGISLNILFDLASDEHKNPLLNDFKQKLNKYMLFDKYEDASLYNRSLFNEEVKELPNWTDREFVYCVSEIWRLKEGS